MLLQQMVENAQTEAEKIELVKILIALWPCFFEIQRGGDFSTISVPQRGGMWRSIVLRGSGKLHEIGYGLGPPQTIGNEPCNAESFVRDGLYDNYIQALVDSFSGLLENWNPEKVIPRLAIPLEDYLEEMVYANSRRFRRFSRIEEVRTLRNQEQEAYSAE